MMTTAMLWGIVLVAALALGRLDERDSRRTEPAPPEHRVLTARSIPRKAAAEESLPVRPESPLPTRQRERPAHR